MTFANLGLSAPIIKAINYASPSPIQKKAIPAVLSGKDVVAEAQTGTGKTAAFVLPMLNILTQGEYPASNQVRALILTPTRELAAQISENITKYSKNLDISSTVVFGGVSINPQMMKLRSGVDILVATPGRLLDLYSKNSVKFNQLEIVVLDEADRMLDMGFIHDIRKILAILPKERQNLLFSATLSKEIKELAKKFVSNPIEIAINPEITTARSVEQWLVAVDHKQKPALLSKLIHDNNWEQVLVFTKTKHKANKLTNHLIDSGISAAAIHGNKSQGARTKALADFKQSAIRVLVATDIASRGIDITMLPQVVNFELPSVPEDYVHRIGRTGRAGATGQAVSLVSNDEVKLLVGIERLINKLIPRKTIKGFDSVAALPITRLGNNGNKKKRK